MLNAPLIVGGGLAGAAAAIDLARAGITPVLLERTDSPHDKICGEFLSGEAAAALCALGVDPRALGAVAIGSVALWAGRRHIAAPLPFAALSLSRRTLDEALLAHAAASGAAVQRGVAVRALHSGGAHTSAGDVPAGALLLASGKHDLRGQPRPAGRDEIGFKQYFACPALHRQLGHTVRVVFFDGGYAGLQPVEGDRLNLCLLVDGGHYRALGSWPALFARLIGEPGLAALADARPLLLRPLAISRVPYGHLARAANDRVWRLGDQAAVIPSFCGDGMAIALESGRLAAAMLAGGASAADYQPALHRRTRVPVRLAMAALHLARHPAGRLAAMAGLGAVPGALALLARATRVAPPPVALPTLAPA
jgi:flavin-dependent dehydrogenase